MSDRTRDVRVARCCGGASATRTITYSLLKSEGRIIPTVSRPIHGPSRRHRNSLPDSLPIALLAVLLSVSACHTPDPFDPTGDWLQLSTENVTQGTFVECPGELGSLSCGTVTLKLADEEKLTIVQTTDETGESAPWRIKGTWSVEDNRLTLISTDEGPTANSLMPIDPPREDLFVYTVSVDALALSAESDQGDNVTDTYLRVGD